MMLDELGGYLDSIRHCSSPVSREEERALFQALRAGDESARERIAEANLRFVVAEAQRYQGGNLELPDLVAEGNVGLLTAIDRFDPSRGFKFISYAVWWIRQAIMQALYQGEYQVRRPMNLKSDLREVDRQYDHLCHTLGRRPTDSELEQAVGMDPEKMEDVRGHRRPEAKVDAPMNQDPDAGTLADLVPAPVADEPDLDQMSDRHLVEGLLPHLEVRQQFIIRSYYGLGGTAPATLEAIGTILGITRERVRQLRNAGMEVLRGLMEGKGPPKATEASIQRDRAMHALQESVHDARMVSYLSGEPEDRKVPRQYWPAVAHLETLPVPQALALLAQAGLTTRQQVSVIRTLGIGEPRQTLRRQAADLGLTPAGVAVRKNGGLHRLHRHLVETFRRPPGTTEKAPRRRKGQRGAGNAQAAVAA